MLKLLCVAILFSFQVNAALNTVAGFTGEKVVLTSMQKNISDSPESVTSSNSSVFPVKSSFLHPGVVSARSMSMGGGALFIIGDDPLSERWLKENKDKLISLNALGMVVNVESIERFNVLRQQAPGLLLMPVNCDDMTHSLKIDAYPVLISNTGISQ